MANTTFKGPVRSQNGFQELVDGVWTPVGGGGGGGTSIVIPNGGTYTFPVSPAGTTITLVQDAYKGELAVSSYFTFSAPDGGSAVVSGLFLNSSTNLFEYWGGNPTIGVNNNYAWFLTFVSLGEWISLYGPRSGWRFSGYGLLFAPM